MIIYFQIFSKGSITFDGLHNPYMEETKVDTFYKFLSEM
jgi:hypothetical protein